MTTLRYSASTPKSDTFRSFQNLTEYHPPPSREANDTSPLRSDDSDSVRLNGGDTEGDFTVDSRTQTIVARRHATQLGSRSLVAERSRMSRSLVAERSRSPRASNQTHQEVFRTHHSITQLNPPSREAIKTSLSRESLCL